MVEVLVVQAAAVLSPGLKSMLQELMVMDVAMLTRAAVESAGKEIQPAAETWSGRRQNDVSLGRNAGSLRRRCGRSDRLWRPW